jgi:hypothetical protein
VVTTAKVTTHGVKKPADFGRIRHDRRLTTQQLAEICRFLHTAFKPRARPPPTHPTQPQPVTTPPCPTAANPPNPPDPATTEELAGVFEDPSNTAFLCFLFFVLEAA